MKNDKVKPLKKTLDAEELLTEEFQIAEGPYERFHDFKENVLGVADGKTLTERASYNMKNRLVIIVASIIFLITNVVYIFRYFMAGDNIPVDLIALITLPLASTLMLVFCFTNKNYDSKLTAVVQDVFYLITAICITLFAIAADIEHSSLSISMCYLFVFFVAPPFDLPDTIAVAVLTILTGIIPAMVPGRESYQMLPHLIIRGAVVIGMFFVHYFQRKQAKSEVKLLSMNASFLKLAYVDVMTSALNNKALKAYRAYAMETAISEPYGVIIYDLDNFKSYNDNYSHMAGDRVLARTSKAVFRVVKKHDTYLFRYGGEEFVILKIGANKEEMIQIGKEVMQAIHDENISRDDIDGTDRVSVSMGCATGIVDGKHLTDNMRIADDQLYIGKEHGKNCFVINDEIIRNN